MISARILLSFVLMAPLASSSAATAYQALRVVRQAKGETVLERVVSLRGIGGAPDPDRWKIILDDPDARGGVRELEVGNGRIISERTPVRGYAGSAEGATLNLQRLNVDSSGAFSVAEREAKRSQMGFDSVDYTLRKADETDAPVWILQLKGVDGGRIGEMHIAADTGSVLQRGDFARRRPERYREEREEIYREERYEERDVDDHEGTFDRVERAFRRMGGTLQEFLTGRRTIDRKYSD